MGHKVGKTHFIIVLTTEGSEKVDALKKLGVEKAPIENYMSLLAIDEVYSNHLGERASKQEMEAAFGTTSKADVVQQIVINGKYQ